MEKEEGKGGGIGRVAGWFFVSPARMLGADELRRNAGQARGWLGAILPRHKWGDRAGWMNPPRTDESFRAMRARLGYDDRALDDIHRLHVVRFYIFLAGVALSAGIGIGQFIGGHILQGLAGIGWAAAFATLCFRASFRARQVREEDMNITPADWMAEPLKWIPPSARR